MTSGRRAVTGVLVAVALVATALPATAQVASFDSLTTSGMAIGHLAPIDINPPSETEFPVAGAGDVNGDGYQDVVVGSQTTATSGNGPSGAAFVVFGSPRQDTVDVRHLGSGGFAIEASQAYDCIHTPGSDGCGPSGQKVGWSVAGAGDVNGDGLSDVLVGAPATEVDSVVRAGAVYVVFGKRSSDPVHLGSLHDGGFAILGSDVGASLGLSVAGLGDVNGDGLSDVAATQDPSRSAVRSAFIVFGKRDTNAVQTATLGADGVDVRNALPAYVEEVCCHDAPVVVSPAGDVNGDGLADVAVGAPGQSPRGRRKAGSIFIIYGTASATSVDVEHLGDGGSRIDGAKPGDWTGGRVADAGDFNGDGIPDLLLNGPTGSFEPSDRGRVWIVYGQRPGRAVDLAHLGRGGTTITGRVGGGVAIDGVGDVNHDGLGDIAVGAPSYQPRCRPAVGSAFVVFGRTSTARIVLDRLGTEGYRIDGAAQFDDLSGALAGAGDLNGDQTPDLVGGTLSPSFDAAGRGPRWTARVIYGRTPIAADLRPAHPACLDAVITSTTIATVLHDGFIRVRVTSRDARARTLTVEITDPARSFYIGRHILARPKTTYRVRVPLDRRARRTLAKRSTIRLRLEAHQLIPAKRCGILFAARPFGTCPGRKTVSHITLAQRSGSSPPQPPKTRFYEPRPGHVIGPKRLAALDDRYGPGPSAAYYRKSLAPGDHIRLFGPKSEPLAWIATYVDRDAYYNVIQPGLGIAIPPHSEDPIPGTRRAPPLLRWVRLEHERWIFGIVNHKYRRVTVRLAGGRTLRPRLRRGRGFYFRLAGLTSRAALTIRGPRATFRQVVE